ncbi:MAG: geranylgeranylglycerol-phosphate geranylgeranyltransferase [Cytophagales bacterium]
MEYFARIFLIGDKSNWRQIILEPEIFYLSAATVFIAAGGYIINDYYDIKIDMINKPNRVILNKYISRRAGIFLHIMLNVAAIVLCVWKLTINVAIFMTLCGFLLWWYSNSLKRVALWGNLAISFLAFSSLSLLALFYQVRVNAILFFSFFAFFTTLIREIIKDMEDTRGDEAFGCKTLPIVYGISRTKNIVYVIIFLTLSVLTFSIFVINANLYIFLAFFSFLPCLYLIVLIKNADKATDFSTVSNYTKWMMVIGIFGMVWV